MDVTWGKEIEWTWLCVTGSGIAYFCTDNRSPCEGNMTQKALSPDQSLSKGAMMLKALYICLLGASGCEPPLVDCY
jgi:hypothetical protein